ncbi:hypothetical protein HHI36_010002 [Cryptolaemus montrouzieri]|uniref:Uncharacterized protein n=1 Tax=Cryptolaemus montrouzieri TaxID=559131 RepID=A0ABD2MHH5_9CUCU
MAQIEISEDLANTIMMLVNVCFVHQQYRHISKKPLHGASVFVIFAALFHAITATTAQLFSFLADALECALERSAIVTVITRYDPNETYTTDLYRDYKKDCEKENSDSVTLTKYPNLTSSAMNIIWPSLSQKMNSVRDVSPMITPLGKKII